MTLKIRLLISFVTLISLTYSQEVENVLPIQIENVLPIEVENVLPTEVSMHHSQPSVNLDFILNYALGQLFKGINQMTVLGLAMRGFKHENVSAECQLAFANLSTAIENGSGDMNAIKFVDASAKIPAGLGMGSVLLFGSYDQCMEADYPSEDNSNFHGQYCGFRLITPQGNSLTLGDTRQTSKIRGLDFRVDACVPNVCSPRDLETAIDNGIKSIPGVGSIAGSFLNIKAGVCQTRDKEAFTTGQITAMVIFAILGAILVVGTLWDILLRLANSFGDDAEQAEDHHFKEGSTMRKIFLSFSIYTNGMKLLNTEQSKDSLTAVNGVRFLSMSWVILGHAYYFINHAVVGNLSVTSAFGGNFAFQAILNGTVSVDSFFFLSGLLVSYVTIGRMRKSGKMNWGLYYFHRVWRLTPAYAAVIMFTLLFPLLGSGPTWKDPNMMGIITNCQKSWWSSLLYINNLYEPSLMCLGHGWYLSNDMQFYVVSPIILYAFYKKPIVGFIINFAFMIASIITPALLCMKYDFPPTSLFFDQITTPENQVLFFQRIYITPYARMGPYCIGLYAGYFLAGNRKLNLSRITKALLWCLAIACNMSVLYGVLEWNKGNRNSTAIHAFYLSTHRTAWAIGLSWVTIACATGNGGVVNSILSWKLFVPLGRTTYLAYLIHPMVQLAYSGLVRDRIMYTDYTHITMYLGFLMISYGLAFGASLAVEAPFLGLEKILFPNVKKETPKDENVDGKINQGFEVNSTELSKAKNGLRNVDSKF